MGSECSPTDRQAFEKLVNSEETRRNRVWRCVLLNVLVHICPQRGRFAAVQCGQKMGYFTYLKGCLLALREARRAASRLMTALHFAFKNKGTVSPVAHDS